MNFMSLYYLSIPIVIGIIVGGFLGTYGVNSNDSETITSTKLVENGSPFLGDSDAPITILAVSYTHLTLPTSDLV